MINSYRADGGLDIVMVHTDIRTGEKTSKSVAIQRLIDEVKNDQENGVNPNAYNRVYSRHNRS